MQIKTPDMPLANPSGIDVLIVGGGIGGLFCAVEMYRHGHKVRVLESKKDVDTIGLCPPGLMPTKNLSGLRLTAAKFR